MISCTIATETKFLLFDNIECVSGEKYVAFLGMMMEEREFFLQLLILIVALTAAIKLPLYDDVRPFSLKAIGIFLITVFGANFVMITLYSIPRRTLEMSFEGSVGVLLAGATAFIGYLVTKLNK